MTYEVTIGIPVYNVEQYIRPTLDAALAQTYDSIEFLILDDCGTDHSMDIVQAYQQTHPRGKDIRIVRQPRNRGIGNTRNRIIDEARGRYLFFLDSDDLLPANAIQVLHEAAVRHHAQIVYGSHEHITDFGGEVKVEKCLYTPKFFTEGDDFANYAYSDYDHVSANVWKFLADVSIYRDNHLRFPEINYWEDFVMTIDMCAYIQRAVFLSDIIYQYYSRYGTLSNNQKRDRISKAEIVATMDAMTDLKHISQRFIGKAYYSSRLLKIMQTSFYVVCSVLRNEKIITPSFTKSELRDFMRYPVSVCTMLTFRKCRLHHVLFYLLGVLPASWSLFAMRQMGKYKGII